MKFVLNFNVTKMWKDNIPLEVKLFFFISCLRFGHEKHQEILRPTFNLIPARPPRDRKHTMLNKIMAKIKLNSVPGTSTRSTHVQSSLVANIAQCTE